ncbi:hypothetical protein DNTS_027198 [Danionella cerebrum]|uniref:Uncharacterized protein n=1 Tax=Danionella cerebrum TaxID=2873325 RepID=A0A553QPE9_9TELE|nr:hypothetical protein DNTS_027198 [Danionella translucida]
MWQSFLGLQSTPPSATSFVAVRLPPRVLATGMMGELDDSTFGDEETRIKGGRRNEWPAMMPQTLYNGVKDGQAVPQVETLHLNASQHTCSDRLLRTVMLS